MCTAVSPLLEKYIHDMGAFLQAQLGGENGDCCAVAADCICIVQSVSSFSCLTGMVLFSLTDQKRKKYLNAMKTKGLALSKSALCLVQFKSKDNQECLFDNSIYNALF